MTAAQDGVPPKRQGHGDAMAMTMKAVCLAEGAVSPGRPSCVMVVVWLMVAGVVAPPACCPPSPPPAWAGRGGPPEKLYLKTTNDYFSFYCCFEIYA